MIGFAKILGLATKAAPRVASMGAAGVGATKKARVAKNALGGGFRTLLREQPIATTVGVGGGTLLGGAAVASPVVEALRDPLGREIRVTGKQQLASFAAQARMERLQRDAAVNEARLAALQPHLYSELEAGRRLPKGGVLFGGTKRRDLVNELVMRMSLGDLKPPATLEEQLGG